MGSGVNMSGIDNYTKLLLHCDGTDASTTFIDSALGKAVTAVGNAQIDTAQKVFGTGSGLFDGTGDYLTTPDHADWYFGTGDFTIDFWVRWNGTPSGYFTMLGQDTDSSNRWNLQWYPNNLYFRVYNGGDAIITHTKAWAPVKDTWYHVAVVRNGTTFNSYIGGTSIGSTTDADSIPDFTGALWICGSETYGEYGNGWMDEIRISKGIARWTANFTPPISAYSKVLAGGLGIGNPYIF